MLGGNFIMEYNLAKLVQGIGWWFILGFFLYKSKELATQKNSLFQKLGGISFNFYLLHFVVLFFCSRFLVEYIPTLTVYSLLFHFTVAILSISITYVFAFVISKQIEEPIRFWSKKMLGYM